ncbi:MAG: ATP-binding cassette domain-containing protein [Anaerolineales bacterium]|uniref:ATP-binding cassette domain-containing protein n=1 Tax=Candidatus Villigracilis vicinus TaxID=3140679 RepID=UPI003134EE7F|nr:ATP-binding cassette domain-containing protein [Anaerolineales bacterium]
MALISLQEVSIGFGGHPLLEGVSFQIERGERVGLLGRNGMGKSTLLKMLNDDFMPHDGVIARQQNVRTAYLPQEVPQDLTGRVQDIIASGLIDSDFADDEHHWKRDNQVQKTISLMELDGDARFETLSAGMKRRIILARGLVCNPDLLLLDEPTNHLDIQAIDWLEDFLKRWGGTLLFVTHDRVFLQKLTIRIIELDRGSVYDWACDYPTFLERKEAMLESEQISNALFDKKLAQEEQWIRKGIEARRTRNEGRVLALKKLRQQRSERRDLLGKVKMQIGTEKRSGRLVIETENISYAYAEKTIIRNFTTTIQRGDKIGIVGANGSGKTTLLKLLMGQLQPQTGEVRHGTNLEIVYFDQLRTQLDESKSVLDNVGQGRDTVTINGRTRNLMGYLEDFLFTRDRVRAPITALSGGERNRLLLARLFAMPANLLILDEPTNDLDIETLEILEDLLLDYEGTLLLVSHDRAFLNNIVTSTLILDGSGDVKEFIGGYEDWQKQLDASPASRPTPKPVQSAQAESKPEVKSRKLSYNEKRELEELPKRIETLEEEQRQLTLKMEAPSFYQQEGAIITQAVERLEQIHKELAQVYERWGELDG